MSYEECKKHIATYKELQLIKALEMPCPRCGKNKLEPEMINNALSRHEDIYICTDCGRDEAAQDFSEQVKPLESWYAVRFLNGEVAPYERYTPKNGKPFYKVTTSVTAKVSDQDIDDIMGTALDGGITGWCGSAKVVGMYLGKFASDQISRGGELILYDVETEEQYRLTRDKFLKGLACYLRDYYDSATCEGRIDPGEIDAEGADCIIQYALFGDIVYG